MVFFNCNACGEALKKNQVDKHVMRCRQCQVLSCVDCGKDFWGNDYQTHTKCITEDEKYCGKGFVAKVNKGEVKQEQWTEKVQAAIEKSASNPKLSGLLERMKDYPNIPRKKQKFENFLKNSLRVMSQPLISQVWETLMEATGNNNTEKQQQEQRAANGVDSQTSTSVEQNGDSKPDEDAVTLNGEASEKKLSKRERKEERRKKANTKEKKDKHENGDVEKEEKNKNGKKRKRATEDDEDIENTADTSNQQENGQSKKKKKKDKADIEDESTGQQTSEVEETVDVSEPQKKRKKTEFNWESIIIAVLKSKGEMSLKKLRKKVLNEFAAQDIANYSEENLKAKFDKKVNKVSSVKVFKDRVKLK